MPQSPPHDRRGLSALLCLTLLAACGERSGEGLTGATTEPTPGASVRPVISSDRLAMDAAASGARGGRAPTAPAASLSATGAQPFVTVRDSEKTVTTITFDPPAALGPTKVPTIAGVSFPGWRSHVDSDESPGYPTTTADIANEPSPSATIFWLTADGDSKYEREIALDRPVSRVRLYYASCIQTCEALYDEEDPEYVNLPFSHTTVRAFRGATPVAADSGSENYNKGRGDPYGSFNQWTRLDVADPTGENTITRLTVTGYNLWIDVDDVELTVKNYAPRAIPGGPYAATEGTPIQFSGTASYDPVDATGARHPKEDPIVAYAWDFGGGATAATATAGHTFLRPGNAPVTLTVRDPNGVSGSTTIQVPVSNVSPVVSAAQSASAAVGQSVNLSATFTDPGREGGPWSYTVRWDDNGPTTTGTVSSWSAVMSLAESHVYTTPGSKNVRITVEDAAGGTGVANLVVTVGNSAPTARVTGPATAPEGAPVSLSAAASTDPEGQALSYAWSFGDATTGTGATVSHVFADSRPTPYTVTVTVTDPHGASDAASLQVAVQNVAPTAVLSAPATATVGVPFTLSLGQASDPSPVDEAAGFGHAFDCGAGYGAFGSSASASCTVSTVQTVTVRARIRDKDGGEREYAGQVAVKAAVVPVTIEVRPEAIRLEGDNANSGMITVFVTASAGFDPRQLDPATVALGNAQGSDTPVAVATNGRLEAQLTPAFATFKFRRADLMARGDLTASTTQLILIGKLLDGRTVSGSDRVRVIP